MIDQLRLMAIFQAVAELGSFRAAAKKLNLSPSVVSHHVSQLEQQLGLPLLYRSTRRISLTDAGSDLLAACRRMTNAAQEGLASISRRTEQPVGRLTVASATPTTHLPFSNLFTRFSKAYPKVELSLEVADQLVSLEGSKFDVAIRGRVGPLDDSSYKAKKLGRMNFIAFTTPEYADGRPLPKTLDDLADWDYIEFPPIPLKSRASVAAGLEPFQEPRKAVTCDNYTMARAYLEAGSGFMVENYPLAAEGLRSGKLIQILQDVEFAHVDAYAIYPANAPRDSMARIFVDFIDKEIKTGAYGFDLD